MLGEGFQCMVSPSHAIDLPLPFNILLTISKQTAQYTLQTIFIRSCVFSDLLDIHVKWPYWIS